MEEKNIFNYDELEDKYDIHIDYPGKAKTSKKMRVMSKLCCAYRDLREKTLPYIPLNKTEKIYWYMKERYVGRKYENSVIGQENAYVKIDFIHMYDFIPKERMGFFIKEWDRFKKEHVDIEMGSGDEKEKTLRLKRFSEGHFRMPMYSIGIKKNSPLYPYISSLYIGFQDLTTSLNVVEYTLVLSEKLIENLNQMFIDHVDDFSYLHCGNLKWYEFYKMGWGEYAGRIYKSSFINDCIEGIKWNVIRLMKKEITFYLVNGKKDILPSVNVYKTNVDGNSNKGFWGSIGIDYPEFCDFVVDYSACINWSNRNKNLDCYYADDNTLLFKRCGFPMDIRYYYSKFVVVEAIIYKTYELIEKSMEKADKHKRQHVNLRGWLRFKADIEKDVLYYKRFYNEQKEYLYNTDDFRELFDKKDLKKSFSEIIMENKKEQVEAASDALNQIIQYIDSNIDYRSANENYRMQKITGLIGFWSMVIAAVAMVATCMGNEDIMNFVKENYKEIIDGVIKIGLILFLWKLIKYVYFKFK